MSIHNQEIQQWIESVQAYIEELCTFQRENRPEVPLFFIRFLHLMLRSCSIPPHLSRVYGVATTLLKMGLDTHIQTHHQAMDVLAGDYLSIQFYCLLSEQGEVEGIRHIARTISQINELKMEHYLWVQQGARYDDGALQKVERISSALVLSIAHFFEDQLGLEKEYWNQIIPAVFLLNEVHSTPYSLTRSGEEYIQRTVVELQETISQLKSASLQEEMFLLLQCYSIFLIKEGDSREHALC